MTANTSLHQKETPTPKPSFEECLERLHKVVSLLEGGNLPLDESLRLFAEGIELTRCCQEYLAEAEKKVEVLLEDAEGETRRRPMFEQEA